MQSASCFFQRLPNVSAVRGTLLRTFATDRSHLSASSVECIALSEKRSVVDNASLPVVLSRGYGARLWDLEGREYLDFLSANNSVNQGHCHPKLVTALASQAATLSATSNVFHNDKLGSYLQKLCTTFRYDRCLLMNTAVEAREMAVHLARRWATEKRDVSRYKAVILLARGDSTISSRNRVSSSVRKGINTINYGDLQQLEKEVRRPEVAAFMVEPIQSESGVIVPPRNYMHAAAELCKRHNTLLIADETHTGLGRTGRLLCVDHDNIRPDMVMLGNALSGGMYPMTAVLASADIAGLIRSGDHGSTSGGNPTACSVAMESLKVVLDEKLAERAENLGIQFRNALQKLVDENCATDVRGMGLLNALELPDDLGGDLARIVCLAMAQQGVLAKPVGARMIRFAPPLVITEAEIAQAVVVITDAVTAVVSERRSGHLPDADKNV